MLVEMVRLVERTLRPIDLVARMGGEEFCVLLRDTDGDAAAVVAERIRCTVEEHDFELPDARTARVTVSLGVVTVGPRGPDAWEPLLRRADDALYRAKRSGRNRVVVASPEAPVDPAQAPGGTASEESPSSTSDPPEP